MKCKRKQWTQALDLLKHVIDPKATITALQQCSVKAEGGYAVISATDLQTEVQVQVPCEGDLDVRYFDWKSLRQLSKAAKATRDQSIVVTAIKAGYKLKIASRTFEIASEPSDRPAPMAGSGEESLECFESETLLRALKFVTPAICRDDSRFQLCGAYLDGTGRLVATDGHRMHLAEGVGGFSLAGPEPILVSNTAVLVDAIKATNARFVMGRLFPKGRKLVEWSVEGADLNVLIREWINDADYPPFDRIIPSHTESFSVDRVMLADSVATAAKSRKARGEEHKGVALLANGALSVDADSFKEIVPLVVKAPREQRLGVDPKYMLDAVTADGDVVEVFYGEELEPIKVVAGENLFAVVMPMRI